MKEKRKILNTLVSTGSFNAIANHVFELSENLPSSYVCITNVHMIMESYKDAEFNKVVNGANLATPDGAPIRYAMKFLYGVDQDRVAGPDLMVHLMQEAEIRSKSIFLYGGTDQVLEKLKVKIGSEFPRLKIAGAYSPPFRTLTEQEDEEVIEMINGSKADLVFVALGCPKQEKWMSEHLDKVNGCMLGLGGAFPMYVGETPRAPKWMQDYALEWLHRLALEPRRLWKRYLVTNSLFIFHFLRFWLSKSKMV